MHRVGGRVLVLLVLAASLSAAPSAPDAVATASLAAGQRAILTRDYQIECIVTPHAGDAWTRLARRMTGDAANWKSIAAFNGLADVLQTDRKVRIPYAMLRPDLQSAVISALFPRDQRTAAGWRHVVVGSRGVEGESLWNIAEWFTGRGDHFTAIRKANPDQGLSTRPGDVVLVPAALLSPAFAGGVEGENGKKASAEVRKSEDDPVERPSADVDAPEEAVEARSVGAPSLTFVRGASEPYAVYHLQKGEALYSSVAIRFTGRVYAKDVGDVLDRIVKFNGIEDVARLPVGYSVRIPMDLLLPEYRPLDDPARLASETSKRESSRLASRRSRTRNLSGVHIVLDAGHGGRDVGTTHDGLWESTYVYDVACRLKQLLEKKTAARVSMTTKSKGSGYEVVNRDAIPERRDHVVLTTPRYELEDPVVGVTFRWYLANSIFRKTIDGGTAREKVVFLSIHADSLHPSLRGVMAYIPGGRYVKGSYKKSGRIYLTRAEVREGPVVRHTEEEALIAEGLSRDLAETIIESFDRSALAVHPFNPIRDNVVRNGREWVPAIIRYNAIPTRLLLEVCNLGNRRDRELMKTKAYRQKVAEAIYAGITSFYADRNEATPPVLAGDATRAASR